MNCSGIGSSWSSPSVDPGLGNETFISLRLRENDVRREVEIVSQSCGNTTHSCLPGFCCYKICFEAC